MSDEISEVMRAPERAISYRDILELLGADSFQTIHSEFAQVQSSAKQWETMLGAGFSAASVMRRGGESNFQIKIDAGSGPAYGSREALMQAAEQAHVRWMTLARQCHNQRKEVSKLSEEEKFAICVAAGIQLRTVPSNALFIKTETAAPCCIVLMEDGYRVFVKPE